MSKTSAMGLNSMRKMQTKGELEHWGAETKKNPEPKPGCNVLTMRITREGRLRPGRYIMFNQQGPSERVPIITAKLFGNSNTHQPSKPHTEHPLSSPTKLAICRQSTDHPTQLPTLSADIPCEANALIAALVSSPHHLKSPKRPI